jgi:hypothetical protein
MDRTMPGTVGRRIQQRPWKGEYSNNVDRKYSLQRTGEYCTADIMDRRKQLPQWTGNKADTWIGEYSGCLRQENTADAVDRRIQQMP